MRIIIVDDESLSLRYMQRLCLEIPHIEVAGCFQNADEAIDFMQENTVDIALLDIEMPGYTGMELAAQMKKVCPGIGVIFITGYEEYALEAFRIDAVDYIMKPCDKEQLEKAFSKATRLRPVKSERLVIKTFGYFTVFIDGEAYPFTNRKAKELLALLIDRRGGEVTMEQATATLWEERPYDHMVKQLYRKALTYLRYIEKENNLHFIASSRGACQVVRANLDCDYYRLLNGETQAKRDFFGEYMLEYSWAEPTAGKIQQMLDGERT